MAPGRIAAILMRRDREPPLLTFLIGDEGRSGPQLTPGHGDGMVIGADAEFTHLAGETAMRVTILVLALGMTLTNGAAAQDTPSSWDFVGRTQPALSVDVRARVPGHVTRDAVRVGDAVKKGDLLVEIDVQPYRLDLEAAQAKLNLAAARFDIARLKAENTKSLQAKGVISSDEVALTQATAAEAQAAVRIAKVEVARAELNVSWTRVTAPFDGRVSAVEVVEGSLVTAEQTKLLTIVSTDLLSVTFSVPEAIVLKLRREGLSDVKDLSATIGFGGEEGFPHEAKMDAIDLVADPKSGTVRFHAALPNPQGLVSPGMTARVRLTRPSK
jgi:RND family efflux transporter MFP subunit